MDVPKAHVLYLGGFKLPGSLVGLKSESGAGFWLQETSGFQAGQSPVFQNCNAFDQNMAYAGWWHSGVLVIRLVHNIVSVKNHQVCVHAIGDPAFDI